jgi:TetR/AcrR family transcriptional regulator, repressor of fatR-cypB operon
MQQEVQKLSRKERERLFKRQEIVNAARTVFASRGFSAATLDEIAEKAEFGKGTLYNYFQSKEELFETVIADVLDEILEIAVSTCVGPGKSLKESYLGFARQLLSHLFTNAGMYNLLMRELHRMDHHPHLAALMPNLMLILEEPLKRSIASGEIDPLPMPEAQAGFIYLTTIFSVFKSIVHIHFHQMCFDGVFELQSSKEEIDTLIDDGIALIERTYFHGILCRYDRKPGKRK